MSEFTANDFNQSLTVSNIYIYFTGSPVQYITLLLDVLLVWKIKSRTHGHDQLLCLYIWRTLPGCGRYQSVYARAKNKNLTQNKM